MAFACKGIVRVVKSKKGGVLGVALVVGCHSTAILAPTAAPSHQVAKHEGLASSASASESTSASAAATSAEPEIA